VVGLVLGSSVRVNATMRGAMGGVSRGDTQRMVLGGGTRPREPGPQSSIGVPPPGVTPTSFSAPRPIIGLGGRRRSPSVGGGLSMITGSPDSRPNLAVADMVPSLQDGGMLDEGAEEVVAEYRQNVKSQISHDALRAVSQSPDGKRLVAGGQEVLSIINTSALTPEGGEVEVEFNILQRTQMVKKRSKCTKVWDVRWHPSEMSKIASTSDDGLVTLWALDGPQKKTPVWEGRDDTRSCWRLAWCHPETGGSNMLCSGSLDGIIRLWDFRTKQSVANFTLGGTQLHAQGASGLKVRDLRVCGAEPWKLAAGMESNNEGDIVVWDLRSNQKPVFRKREETAVYAVDWHPEHSSILATGRTATQHAPGAIKVWDLNTAATDGTDLLPIAKIITPEGVSNIMWRPTFRTHLAVTYLKIPVVHVWDLLQHTSPLVSLCGHSKPVADLVWQDAHVLSSKDNVSDEVCWVLSCSEDGTVQRQHMCNGYHPFQHRRNTTHSMDQLGHVMSSYSSIQRGMEQIRQRRRTKDAIAAHNSNLKAGSVLHEFVSGAGRPRAEAAGRALGSKAPGLGGAGHEGGRGNDAAGSDSMLLEAVAASSRVRDGGGAGGTRKSGVAGVAGVGGAGGVGEGPLELDVLLQLAREYRFASPRASTPTLTLADADKETPAGTVAVAAARLL
jgi:WD40 repeat protein